MKQQSKKIGIDLRPYIHDKSGIGQYIYQLTQALLKNDNTNEYILFADEDFNINDNIGFKKIIYKNQIPKVGSLLYHLKTIIYSKKLCDEYITASSLYVPAFRKNFATLVIHDLIMLSHPDTHEAKVKILSSIFLKHAVKNSKRLIAVSENTKKDIKKFFPEVNINKIHVALEGYNETLLKQVENYEESFWNQTRDKFKIGNFQYILFVGTIQPRKNVLGLIKAFEVLRKEYNTSLKLVIVGRMGWKNEELLEYINKIGPQVRTGIIITGFVSEKEKAYLYKNAFVMCYPSFYEGFGLPLLEAMSFQIPFVTSNTSSFPEVVADAGILVDPNDVNAIASAIQKYIDNESYYTEIQNKEKDRIKLFEWNHVAKKIIQILS